MTRISLTLILWLLLGTTVNADNLFNPDAVYFDETLWLDRIPSVALKGTSTCTINQFRFLKLLYMAGLKVYELPLILEATGLKVVPKSGTCGIYLDNYHLLLPAPR